MRWAEFITKGVSLSTKKGGQDRHDLCLLQAIQIEICRPCGFWPSRLLGSSLHPKSKADSMPLSAAFRDLMCGKLFSGSLVKTNQNVQHSRGGKHARHS